MTEEECPDVYLDTSVWMALDRRVFRLHKEGVVQLRVSDIVLNELKELQRDEDEATVERANRAMNRIRELKPEGIYKPESRLGRGRMGEILLGRDSIPLPDADLNPKDKEVAKFAVSGHIDFAKQGKVRYFVSQDHRILRNKKTIQNQAPGMDVLNIDDFLAHLGVV